jgi:Uma2 family endonuclease
MARLATADELLHYPRDGWRYELVAGELRRMSPAGSSHGAVAMQLGILLAQHVSAQRLGRVFAAETGFVLARNPDTVRAPDVAFVRRERLGAELPEGFWPGPPDLAAEVVSPGDSFTEVQEKALCWLDAGTRMVLVVDPQQRTATVYRSRADVTLLGGDDVIDGGDVVPGWRAKVAELFD